MIREAVQSNLGKRRRRPAHRWRAILPHWAWVSVLSAGAALLIPRIVVSTDQPSPSPPVYTRPAQLPALWDDKTVPVSVPTSAPSAIDREALPLAVRGVVIDAGHGGEQHGAVSESGLAEKDITLDIALRLRRLMDQSRFRAILTRETDQTMPLEARVELANSSQADLFVSIHVNWLQQRFIRPLETYYAGATDDPELIRLAGLENQNSGYSLSEYRQLLDKLYLDTRRYESRLLAETINTALYGTLSRVNPGMQNRGVRRAPFAVLVGTRMPAVLVEVSALSNQEDVRLLQDEQYRERAALAILRGINSYANNLGRTGSKDF